MKRISSISSGMSSPMESSGLTLGAQEGLRFGVCFACSMGP